MTKIVGIILSFSMAFAPAFALAQTLPTDTANNTTPPPMEEMTPPPMEETTAPMPVPPSISSVSVTDITDTSARIDVNSDEVVQGYVEYGTSEQYGMSTPLTSEFSTSPSFKLTNLSPEMGYHYRVIVMDSSGTAAITGDETFTTLATPKPEPEPEQPATSTSVGTSTSSTHSGQTNAPQAITTPPAPATSTPSANPAATSTPATHTFPTISNVSSTVSTTSATITWTTSKPATSDIQYGTTTSYASSLGKDVTLKTSHERTIANLSAGELYHFRIVAADNSGNTALGKDRTFTTAAESSAPVAPTPTPVATSTAGADTLKRIAEQGAQAAATSGGGGGGLPVVPTRPLLLKVTPLDGQVAFDWRKDTGIQNGAIHTLIIKKEGTTPVLSRIDGGIIYDGPSTTFTDTDVENGKEYHYALYSYGAYGRFTTAARFKVIPRADEQQVDLSAAEIEIDTPPVFSRDLHQGKQGDDVKSLQAHLADNGYYPEALITGYFGPLTRAAVIRYQRLNDITPAIGYVGPVTRGVLGQ